MLTKAVSVIHHGKNLLSCVTSHAKGQCLILNKENEKLKSCDVKVFFKLFFGSQPAASWQQPRAAVLTFNMIFKMTFDLNDLFCSLSYGTLSAFFHLNSDFYSHSIVKNVVIHSKGLNKELFQTGVCCCLSDGKIKRCSVNLQQIQNRIFRLFGPTLINLWNIRLLQYQTRQGCESFSFIVCFSFLFPASCFNFSCSQLFTFSPFFYLLNSVRFLWAVLVYSYTRFSFILMAELQ